MFYKKFLTVFILANVSGQAMAQPCQSESLKATYQVTSQAKEQGEIVEQLNLWRNGRQVAHQHSDKQIVELWYLQKNQRLSLTRHFESFERGIEYQAQEVRHVQGVDWQSKSTLVSSKLLQSLNKQRVEQGNDSCETLEYYVKKDDQQQVTLAWYPKLQLVKQLTIEKVGMRKRWILVDKTTNQQLIAQQYRHWAGFQTTDYADIGDMESDPFLLKMINLGYKLNH